MNRLIALTRDLCLLRVGPQDFPFSPELFRNLLLFALLVELLVRWWLGVREAGLVLVAVAFLARLGLVYGLLGMAGRQARYLQCMSAMLAIGIAFTLMLAPVLAGLLPLPEPGQAPTPVQGLMVWLALGLVIWNLVVDGHILRHTLEIRLFQGVLLALALLLVQFSLALMAAQLLGLTRLSET
jgi:hypothetical protein